MTTENTRAPKHPRLTVLRNAALLLACLSLAPAAIIQAQTSASAKKQLPADERAYKAARSLQDPDQSITALRAFLKDYPKSTRTGRAQDAIFNLLVDNFPQRTADIDKQAKLLVKQSGKGGGRYREETYVAWKMAESGTSGADLPKAEKYAKDAAERNPEARFNTETTASYVKYKIPAPKPAELHSQYAQMQAEALATLANVYLREGRQAQATSLVAESYKLDPNNDDVNCVRGRLALLDHNDALALESFERAQLVGALAPADREKMKQLYKQAHNGSDTGLDADLDAQYARIFPEPFTPEKPKPLTPGHTVLLELFTGSACGPCVGGDLAVEALLKTYPREEVVALAFDQHIPDPDPLTNPDSVARAGVYGVAHTPEYVLDGTVIENLYGGHREGSQELYKTITKNVDTQAALATGVQLKLTASEMTDGIVHAEAALVVPSIADVTKALEAVAPKPAPPEKTPADKKKKVSPLPAPPPAAAPSTPHLLVNFALVEDDIRYSGENGIRFHRMVVRSLAKPAGSGFPIEAGTSATLTAAFDPAAISKDLAAYLTDYEQHNDRFGKMTFLTHDTTIDPRHLAIAAWVQDETTHRILQSTIIPVGKPMQGAE